MKSKIYCLVAERYASIDLHFFLIRYDVIRTGVCLLNGCDIK